MKHILLLEDDQSVVDLLTCILEEDGYYVSSTLRVADAQEILEKAKVDLFVADMLLPDGTAFPAIEEAKRRNVSYLIITGSWPHMAQLEANGEFHLTKPFRLKDFVAQVIQRIGPGKATTDTCPAGRSSGGSSSARRRGGCGARQHRPRFINRGQLLRDQLAGNRDGLLSPRLSGERNAEALGARPQQRLRQMWRRIPRHRSSRLRR